MGDEIAKQRFTLDDFREFNHRLTVETKLLEQYFNDQNFGGENYIAGLELEAWIIDAQLNPNPINSVYIKRLNSPMFSPELALFNFELNTTPRTLNGAVFSGFKVELDSLWAMAGQKAEEFNSDIVLIGILPTLLPSDLRLENISRFKRYYALNSQVMSARREEAVHIDIKGREHLCHEQADVMMEAATTSLQIHLQMPFTKSMDYYRAASFASILMVALCANSPYLFGRELWEETRIPLFEQSINLGSPRHIGGGRVGFGRNFPQSSLFDIFRENLEFYPPLLPMLFDSPPEEFRHLKLHNGTIWRWNRPLIGFDDNGKPHIRIEHRVPPAGPALVDSLANMAFFTGVVTYLVAERRDLIQMDFSVLKRNFYQAARNGIAGQIEVGGTEELNDYLLKFVTHAKTGLKKHNVSEDDIDFYLGIITERLQSRQTGAAWQKKFIRKYGKDMSNLLGEYINRQKSGLPAGQWKV